MNMMLGNELKLHVKYEFIVDLLICYCLRNIYCEYIYIKKKKKETGNDNDKKKIVIYLTMNNRLFTLSIETMKKKKKI